MEKYIVISVSEDGDVYIDRLDQFVLEERINSNYWGESVDFLSTIPDGSPMDWPGDSILIIKGDVVLPKKETIVTRYKL